MRTDLISGHPQLRAGYFARTLIVALTLVLVGLMPATSKSEDYRLGAGDLLTIAVFDHEELSIDARVSQTGNITFPLVGQVPVAGLSTRDAELLLARHLMDGAFLKQPQVSILVSEYQSQKVAVMGQVTKPGQYPLDALKKVIDVMSLAGRLLNDTAADDASLVRADGSRVVIDLQKLFDGDPTMNLVVHDVDTLVVRRPPQFYVY